MATFADTYFSRFPAADSLIWETPDSNLNIIVTIPCFNEPDLITSLKSLAGTKPHKGKAEVIVLINNSNEADDAVRAQNEQTYNEANDFAQSTKVEHVKFHILYADNLPKKHAGVGLARKMAMDEAVHRFAKIGKPNGIITGFDADSLCETNYFQAIETHFENHPKSNACSLLFEHPLEGTDFSPEIYTGIQDYELHLRYFKHAMAFTGFPYGFYTIGSSFAVFAETYAKEGGMNNKKAGEDFYFLQKIIALGKFTECNTTCVIPSPRISDRVPFGTGAAVKKIIESEQSVFLTYNFAAFEILRNFRQQIPGLYQDSKTVEIHPKLQKFLLETDFYTNLKKIRINSANESSFEKHFFTIFNAFKIIRFLNTTHEIGDYKKIPVADAAACLFEKSDKKHVNPHTSLGYLKIIRNWDRAIS